MRLRSRVSRAASLCLAVGLAATAPAHAAPPVGAGVEYGTGANAAWSVESPDAITFVYIAGVERRSLSPAPGSERASEVLIAQDRCDAEADELVSVILKSADRASDGEFRVSPVLADASLTRSVTLTGFEQRMPGCYDPDFDQAEETEIGPFSVDLTSRWTGTGPLWHDGRSRHLGELGRCEGVGADGYVGRDATVAASIRGADRVLGGVDLSQLPEPTFAGLGTHTGGFALADLKECFD